MLTPSSRQTLHALSDMHGTLAAHFLEAIGFANLLMKNSSTGLIGQALLVLIGAWC